MRQLLIGIALTLALIGCASFAPVTLQHPITQKKATCDGSQGWTGGLFGAINARNSANLQNRCISDYQRQGYERVPE